MNGAPDVEVIDEPARERFEGRIDGQLVGVIDYISLPGKVIATHTEVLEGSEGQGIGSTLVSGMVERLRADGRQVQPLCPYIAAYLRRHPEYADVVDTSTPH